MTKTQRIEYWIERLAAHRVPAHLHGGLLVYFEDHLPPGDGLLAILENDLRQTLNRADPDTLAGLVNIVSFLMNEAPAEAWGSPALVRAWLAARARLVAPIPANSTWGTAEDLDE
jgi:hypothetical protein